jgi:hypothetical protein
MASFANIDGKLVVAGLLAEARGLATQNHR